MDCSNIEEEIFLVVTPMVVMVFEIGIYVAMCMTA